MRGRKPNAPTTPGVADAPTPPDWLLGVARREWDRVLPLLCEGGVVQRVDLAILAAYCSTWALWVACASKLRAEDVVGDDGKLNPLARYTESLLKQLRGLLDQLGFTPAARRQILTGRPVAKTIEDVLA